MRILVKGFAASKKLFTLIVQVSLVLVKGADYKSGDRGALVYLNAGKDLQPTLERVEKNGGKVLLAKTEISPEMGYFAFFSDAEGNKMGLHSSH